MKQRPRPARGRLADPERTRRVVAKLHGLTAAEADQLEGDTLDQLVASARAIKAGNPPSTTNGGSTVVDEDGRTYDGGGELVDGAGRQMLRQALADHTRGHTRTTSPTGRTARKVSEDRDARRLRIEERIYDEVGRARTVDRERRIAELIEQRHTNHDPKDAA